MDTNTAAQAAKKRMLYVAVAVVALIGLQYQFHFIPMPAMGVSAVPTAVSLDNSVQGVASTSNDPSVTLAPLPSTQPAPTHGTPVRFNIWAWNAMMGAIYANGGPVTTKGSLMDKHGVTVKMTRQDDTEKSKAEQVKLAQALANGDPNPSVGIHYVIIMGDGAAQYLAALNKLTEKLGPDFKGEVIGSVGYSYGEDGWWGPQEWKDSPEASKGGATAGVLRDGDWNIAQFKLANDGIKNNPDEKTWDPDAMNWFAADDYLKAVEMYVSGYCEDRPVARNGKLTGEPKHKTCVQGYVTWTPGDVNGAKAKGGLVRLLSTRENVYQMPSVVIGIHRWNAAHAKQTAEMLAAFFEGGDQVRNFDQALNRAGQASYAIYAEQSAAYWVKYYRGVVERDKTQQPVPLGGSRVSNLADNLVLFGLAEGAGGLDASLFKATYEGFGNVVKQQYPRILPSFPLVGEATNISFIQSLAATMQTKNAATETFDAAAPVEKSAVVASRNWSIQFETGQATFTPAALETLNKLYDQLGIGGALTVEIDGHTDNTGSATANQALSEARAGAVRSWLQSKSSIIFPNGRVFAQGFGDTKPIASNETPEGRAKNRRVTIVLGAK